MKFRPEPSRLLGVIKHLNRHFNAMRLKLLLAGYGYMEDYDIARAWRDGRVQTIYGGTTEIMKEIIGKSIGLGSR